MRMFVWVTLRISSTIEEMDGKITVLISSSIVEARIVMVLYTVVEGTIVGMIRVAVTF